MFLFQVLFPFVSVSYSRAVKNYTMCNGLLGLQHFLTCFFLLHYTNQYMPYLAAMLLLLTVTMQTTLL